MKNLYYFINVVSVLFSSSFIFNLIYIWFHLFILLCNFFRNLFPCCCPVAFFFYSFNHVTTLLLSFLFIQPSFSSFFPLFPLLFLPFYVFFSISFCFFSCLLFFCFCCHNSVDTSFCLLFLTIIFMFFLYTILSKYIYYTQTCLHVSMSNHGALSVSYEPSI
jgi:hypothetical protein